MLFYCRNPLKITLMTCHQNGLERGSLFAPRPTIGGEAMPRNCRALGFAAALAIASAAAVLVSHAAWSQARTLKMIVPFAPGGSADLLGRLLGEKVGKEHGLTVVTENRPGASNSIAYEAAARAVPDGNTVVLSANSLVINPIMRKVNYDPLTSFEPVCYLVSSPQVIAVNGASPYRTLADLIAAARAKPGELTFASVGPGSTQHIGIEQLKQAAKVDLTYIPYTGGAPAMNALLGGHVTAVLGNYSEVAEQLGSDKLRVLAATGRMRIEQLPNVPTVSEAGYKGYDVEVWFGMLAPAKTPKAQVSELATWFTAAMQAPEIKSKLVGLGLNPVGICGADYTEHIRNKYDEYSRVIKEANIHPE
jgi:tripartite-type tricarboxylate transporter receptor subunit TctC